MLQRLELAKRKGCDGVEPDNVDGHEDDNDTGFGFGFNDQLVYNKWLADRRYFEFKRAISHRKNVNTIVERR